MKSILFVVALISLAKIAGGCCCSAHFGYYNCYCNIFNCNCKDSSGKKFTDTEDGYCQYNNFIDHLATLGTDPCHSHWKELACGSQSRGIDLHGNDTSETHGPMDIYNLLDKDQDGYVSKEELWNSVYFAQQFIESRQENSGNLQVLLAKMYSQATFSIMFEQLDLNENGKIDPHEIDESLEDQIKPRAIKDAKKNMKKKTYLLIKA